MLDVTQALCAQTDPEIFFPDVDYNHSNEARRICVTCPLMEKCLDEALLIPREINFGIWGGSTAQQRKQIMRGQATKEYVLNKIRQEFS
jgi:hypothetical protein